MRNGLRLLKGGHEYLFGWERGQEARVLAVFAELARDPRSNFSWLDAAILTHQLQASCGEWDPWGSPDPQGQPAIIDLNDADKG
jgi:hypothetical protein